ncbi:MAG: dTMP kinase [Gammaproteobacteria bacterium]|nr:MAG: dTMP kinase [Gammaproteobacteria bacterium]
MSGRAAFITFEGLEGVGKTTNRDHAARRLAEAGIDAITTREPGGTDVGEQLRELMLHQEVSLRPETEMLLMAAARVEHLAQVIEPALAAGRWVLCDRYLDASVAYQGAGRELGVERVLDLHRLAGVTRRPDLTLLLDMPVAAGRQRAGARSAPDKIEREDDGFFARARKAYLDAAAAEPERVVVIDASRSLTEVQASINEALAALYDRLGTHDHALPGPGNGASTVPGQR